VNGIRCAILLEETRNRWGDFYVSHWGATCGAPARVFGSHSEAKKQLPKWVKQWPEAQIVDEVDL
jgi:hypothetical protein